MRHDGSFSRAGSEPAAIVTCDAESAGRRIAAALAARRWEIVLVYLEDQAAVEAAVDDVIGAEGRIVAVRADLADTLDVERLFTESTRMFGTVDAVVHATADEPSLLFRSAAQHLRRGGVIVSVVGRGDIEPDVGRCLRERSVSVGVAPPEGVLAFLETWRRGWR